MKLSFDASPSPLGQESLRFFEERYDTVPEEQADIVVVLGGDGHVLKALHRLQDQGKPVYALRRTSSVGFLCNDYAPDDLLARLARAQIVNLPAIRVACKTVSGETEEALALNEVTLLRETAQSAKMSVYVDGVERLSRYSGDGLLISTPAGSTAYNHSAGGPIMPLDSNTLVVTAISGFRPRRWSYAVLPQNAVIEIHVIETEKRPVRLEAGPSVISHVAQVRMELDLETRFPLLFDPEQPLSERIIREQFMSQNC
ncbi:MAG: NAD kinase [Alphaproteobacteria bacterium]|nr:NAD kinase [Alphaproteobacteria bacterium]